MVVSSAFTGGGCCTDGAGDGGCTGGVSILPFNGLGFLAAGLFALVDALAGAGACSCVGGSTGASGAGGGVSAVATGAGAGGFCGCTCCGGGGGVFLFLSQNPIPAALTSKTPNRPSAITSTLGEFGDRVGCTTFVPPRAAGVADELGPALGAALAAGADVVDARGVGGREADAAGGGGLAGALAAGPADAGGTGTAGGESDGAAAGGTAEGGTTGIPAAGFSVLGGIDIVDVDSGE